MVRKREDDGRGGGLFQKMTLACCFFFDLGPFFWGLLHKGHDSRMLGKNVIRHMLLPMHGYLCSGEVLSGVVCMAKRTQRRDVESSQGDVQVGSFPLDQFEPTCFPHMHAENTKEHNK